MLTPKIPNAGERPDALSARPRQRTSAHRRVIPIASLCVLRFGILGDGCRPVGAIVLDRLRQSSEEGGWEFAFGEQLMGNGARDQLPRVDARVESVQLSRRAIMKGVYLVAELMRTESAGPPLIELITEHLEFGAELTLPRDTGEFPETTALVAAERIAIHVASQCLESSYERRNKASEASFRSSVVSLNDSLGSCRTEFEFVEHGDVTSFNDPARADESRAICVEDASADVRTTGLDDSFSCGLTPQVELRADSIAASEASINSPLGSSNGRYTSDAIAIAAGAGVRA